MVVFEWFAGFLTTSPFGMTISGPGYLVPGSVFGVAQKADPSQEHLRMTSLEVVWKVVRTCLINPSVRTNVVIPELLCRESRKSLALDSRLKHSGMTACWRYDAFLRWLLVLRLLDNSYWKELRQLLGPWDFLVGQAQLGVVYWEAEDLFVYCVSKVVWMFAGFGHGEEHVDCRAGYAQVIGGVQLYHELAKFFGREVAGLAIGQNLLAGLDGGGGLVADILEAGGDGCEGGWQVHVGDWDLGVGG